MTFADKALHFKKCASKARDEGARQQFGDAAEFYRELAAIAPDFPPRFPGGKIWHGSRWEKRAEECRTMAEYFKDPTTKAMMNRLADTYEKMANAAE